MGKKIVCWAKRNAVVLTLLGSLLVTAASIGAYVGKMWVIDVAEAANEPRFVHIEQKQTDQETLNRSVIGKLGTIDGKLDILIDQSCQGSK